MENRQAENILSGLEEVREEIKDKDLKEKINQVHYSFQLLLEYENID